MMEHEITKYIYIYLSICLDTSHEPFMRESHNPKICGETGMLDRFWAFHPVLQQLNVGLSAWAVG